MLVVMDQYIVINGQWICKKKKEILDAFSASKIIFINSKKIYWILQMGKSEAIRNVK